MYNCGERVLKSIQSVVTQSVQAFELIIIDDASDDNSIRYVTSFLQDNRLKLLSLTKNKGLANALNQGLEASSTPIIIHLDSDDWLEQNALEVILNYFENQPDLGAVYGNPVIHTAKAELVKQCGFETLSSTEFFSYQTYQVPRAYRKRCLIEIGGWSVSDAHNGRLYEDRLTLYAVSLKNRVKHIDQHLYNVYDRSNSLSRSNPLQSAAAKLSILWTEANKINHLVKYNYNGKKLEAQLLPLAIEKLQFRWSIVIPFYKYSKLLYYSVRSWLQSDLTETESEIIIVDDNSGENLEKVKMLNEERVKIIVLLDKKGPAFARNLGTFLAKYEMVFFSDADHIVSPTTLQKHELRHLQTKGKAAVVGCVLGKRTFTHIYKGIDKLRKERLLEISYFSNDFEKIADQLTKEIDFDLVEFSETDKIWEKVERFSFSDAWLADWAKIIIKFGENLIEHKHKWTRLSSGSFSIQKSDLLSVNGFTEELKSMEDWELGIRLQKAEIEIICSPESEPYHQVHPVDTDRQGNDQASINYLLRVHKNTIDNLFNDVSDILPPASAFLKKVIKRNVNVSSNSGLVTTNAGFEKFNLKHCMLSFDDGPHPIMTRKILSHLNQYGYKAIFFVLGNQIEHNEDLIKEMAASGHEIGIHSWVHESSENLTSFEIEKKLKRTFDLIVSLTGDKPRFARPPYGRLSPSYLQACTSLELQPFGWTLSTKDWEAYSYKDILIKIASQQINNKVILFHDGIGQSEATIFALNWLLKVCKNENIKPMLPDEFLTVSPLPAPTSFNPFIEFSQ